MKNKKDIVLENWMKEFFPYAVFRKAGLFTKEMRGDYKAQADRICGILGLKSIYEYRKKEIRCHITYGRPLNVDESGKLTAEPFITVLPSIWDESK